MGVLESEAEAAVRSAVARFDVWLLPVLNVYLLGEYTWNSLEVATTVNLSGNNTVDFVYEGALKGPLFGGAMTLAGGYKQPFATLDASVTHSHLGEPSELLASLYSVRAGSNTTLEENPSRSYTRATHWDMERTIEGTIPLGGEARSAPSSSLWTGVRSTPGPSPWGPWWRSRTGSG